MEDLFSRMAAVPLRQRSLQGGAGRGTPSGILPQHITAALTSCPMASSWRFAMSLNVILFDLFSGSISSN